MAYSFLFFANLHPSHAQCPARIRSPLDMLTTPSFSCCTEHVLEECHCVFECKCRITDYCVWILLWMLVLWMYAGKTRRCGFCPAGRVWCYGPRIIWQRKNLAVRNWQVCQWTCKQVVGWKQSRSGLKEGYWHTGGTGAFTSLHDHASVVLNGHSIWMSELLYLGACWVAYTRMLYCKCASHIIYDGCWW